MTNAASARFCDSFITKVKSAAFDFLSLLSLSVVSFLLGFICHEWRLSMSALDLDINIDIVIRNIFFKYRTPFEGKVSLISLYAMVLIT